MFERLYFHDVTNLQYLVKKYNQQLVRKKWNNLFRTKELNIGNVARNVGNSMRKKCKSEHKFGGAKVSKAEHVRKYFEVFG